MLPDPREKPWLTVDETVATPGWPLGRTQTYAAVKSGAIRSLRLGSRLAIPTVELWRMAGLDANNSGAPEGAPHESPTLAASDQEENSRAQSNSRP